MRVLVIDQMAKTKVMRVKKYAMENRRTIHDIMRAMKGQDIPGDDQNFVAWLHDGYKVVYTVEQQPLGWCHHISVSIKPRSAKALYPHEQAVKEICRLFELPPFEQKIHTYIEDLPEGFKAVNLIFKFEDGQSGPNGPSGQS